MLEYKGYVGKVEYDPDARILHGQVIGIRDVVTFQGTSVDEIEREFRASVDDYLAFCKERGEEPDKPCSGKFVVRVSPQLHRQAAMIAGAKRKSLNEWIVQCIKKGVQRSSPGMRTTRRAEKTSRPKAKAAATRRR